MADIGKPLREIEVNPEVIPVPEKIPMPAPEKVPEPEKEPVGV